MFKHATEKAVWYYNLLKRTLHEHIDKKPLVMFMNGKYTHTLTNSDKTVCRPNQERD